MNAYPMILLPILIIISSSCLWRTTEQHDEDGDNCIHKCGNISLPYPFGIGPNHCYLDPHFAVSCSSSSSSSPRPFLKKLNLEIIKVQILIPRNSGSVIVKMPSLTVCSTNDTGTVTKVVWTSPNLANSSLEYSKTDNVFASVGCDGYALFYNEVGEIIGACTSDCSLNPPAMVANRSKCYGHHCCQILYPGVQAYIQGINQYSVGVSLINNNTTKNCRSAFFIGSTQDLENIAASSSSGTTTVPVVLQWGPFSFSRLDYTGLILTISLPVGIPLLICGGCWGWWRFKTKKRRKEIQLRAKYFNEKLKVQGSTSNDATNKTKLFTLAELKRYTNNFSMDRLLGRGGQGIIYKGMLKDGQVIAIKRSRLLDETQWKPYINEVILLSQIKHKHVVRILGCCLDGDYPLVIYEFICNGTLSEHIQKSTDKEFIFTWEVRLRIAYEVATAIAYLHSEFSTPIFHRDIKSSNILLDDKFRAKLSDFGISRAVSVEQTHLTTCVQGTFGYLDPQYFYSSQYSEKSDVYSFGVVLLELLTGQKAIRSQPLDEDKESKDQEEEEEEEEEEPSLVMYFISSMNDSTLLNIVDPIVSESGRIEDIKEFANLAKLCFNRRRLERPTMKEIAMVLERLSCGSSSNHMPLMSNDAQVNDWKVDSSNSMDTSTEIESAYLRSNTYDHIDLIEHSESVDVEMRLLRTI